MAMKHRKLFPTSTETNQTVECPVFCEITCPDGCYSYSELIPPLPQLPPPPPSPPPSAADQLDQEQPISPYVIIILCLLASFFLLVTYYAIIVKYCSGSRNRPPPSQSDDTDEEFLDENRGPATDHHIWFITTVGLQQSIINSITVCKYKKGEGLIEGSECSVCLSEFQEDQTLRLLPKCNHAFHIPCIDPWLRSHTNCPLCRATIVTNTLTSSVAPIDQNSYNSGPIEEAQIETSVSDGQLGDNQFRDGGVCDQNRAGTEDGVEMLRVDHEGKDFENSIEGLNSTENGVFRVAGDSDNNYQVVGDEIQPVRRSISLNSLSMAATICLGLANFRPVESEGDSVNQIVGEPKSDSSIGPKRDGGNSSIFKSIGSSSIGQSLHKSPVSMKRSFSCGGKFFSSRHNWSTNSILPS